MDSTSSTAATRGRRRLGLLALACLLTPLSIAPVGALARTAGSGDRAAGSDGRATGANSRNAGSGPPDSASLTQCVNAARPAERSATFVGEMSTIRGASRMSMRVELLERTPGDTGYHPVLAPGVGAWRTADPGVKTYKHLERFTNLAAPASYRVLVTFRWQRSHGHVVRRDEQRSPRCVQAAPAYPAPTSSAPASPLE
jgi:hypothetical protein